METSYEGGQGPDGDVAPYMEWSGSLLKYTGYVNLIFIGP